MSQVQGQFQITSWDEVAYQEREDGAKQSLAKITQQYTGAIEGTSTLQYLMCYRADGDATFVGFETVTGTVDGKSGSFVLQHNGTFSHGVAQSQFQVVAGSATDELAPLVGIGSFTSGEQGQAQYQLEFSWI